ncbi:unnamed protein product [Ambrosiozyma monospora]|uniref:Unnamed protein product n=1 Tax=Ambrosiozyma monospora TaxID=43982 RepID=A0A9W7DKE0_AMBMO|nr:unnamed protein product [Ambrosiozyma monospora]
MPKAAKKSSKTSAFVKKLASNDRKTRDQALETLKKFLSTRASSRPFSELELQKLWKGLYYTMWYCDRPRPQQRLANDLASLFSECIPADNFAIFVQAFWVVMIKEWPDLDQWRLDKFYMLMRYVVRESFSKLKNEKWNEGLVDSYIKCLSEGVLSGDVKIPNGIVFHIIDVWLDEFERVVFEKETASKEDDEEEDEEEEEEEERKNDGNDDKEEILQLLVDVPTEKLLAPFRAIRKDALMKVLREKVRDDMLLDPRLQSWDIESGEKLKKSTENDDNDDDESDDEKWNGFGN